MVGRPPSDEDDKYTQVSVSLAPKHLKKLEKLLNKKAFKSRSEIIQKAIENFTPTT